MLSSATFLIFFSGLVLSQQSILKDNEAQPGHPSCKKENQPAVFCGPSEQLCPSGMRSHQTSFSWGHFYAIVTTCESKGLFLKMRNNRTGAIYFGFVEPSIALESGIANIRQLSNLLELSSHSDQTQIRTVINPYVDNDDLKVILSFHGTYRDVLGLTNFRIAMKYGLTHFGTVLKRVEALEERVVELEQRLVEQTVELQQRVVELEKKLLVKFQTCGDVSPGKSPS